MGRGIQAVGILGSDLYDKLPVLQALRPVLPDALFFTTDLDAPILHPIALTSTRNLRVASSFGLQLRPHVQKEIPPFRSSYQTAGLLATRVALRQQRRKASRAVAATTRFFSRSGDPACSNSRAQGLMIKVDGHRKKSDQTTRLVPATCLNARNVHRLATAMFPEASIASAVLFAGRALAFSSA